VVVTTWSIGEAAESAACPSTRCAGTSGSETLKLLDAKIGSYERRVAEAPHANAL